MPSTENWREKQGLRRGPAFLPPVTRTPPDFLCGHCLRINSAYSLYKNNQFRRTWRGFYTLAATYEQVRPCLARQLLRSVPDRQGTLALADLQHCSRP